MAGDRFKIWGQVQELSPGRYLVMATSCPVASGRQTSFSMVVTDAGEARQLLSRLMAKLERQVLSAGGSIVSVHSLPPRSNDAGPSHGARA
jgi:hypothetical protein